MYLLKEASTIVVFPMVLSKLCNVSYPLPYFLLRVPSISQLIYPFLLYDSPFPFSPHAVITLFLEIQLPWPLCRIPSILWILQPKHMYLRKKNQRYCFYI